MPDVTKLLSTIDSYSAAAHGSESDGGELSKQRALALDAYAGKNIEPSSEGRSQVVDWTVFETVQWIMPSLMRIFAGGDNIVEFEPTGPEDEDAAEQESDYINYLVTQRNDWDLIARTWMQDALITKNAYCLVSMEEKRQVELETYENQTEEQLALILEDDVEVIEQEQFDDPEDDGQLIDPTTGQPAQDEETMIGALAIYEAQGVEPQIVKRQLFNIKIRRTKVKPRLCFKVLPPEHCKVDNEATDFTLDDADYFEYWERVRISELRKMGYDVPDDIGDQALDSHWDTQEDASRDEFFEETETEADISDPSQRMVTARWIWVRHDYDEDGIAELQHVFLVGREVLDREEINNIPVACLVPFINTHRHIGVSVADLTFDIQRIKTWLLRAFLDSIGVSVNPRHVVSERVHLDDLLTLRPGAVVRLKNGAIPGEGHVMPLQTEFVAPYAKEGLLHMDTVVEARVGVNRMFQGIDESSINDHNRIGQLSTMAAQRVEDIARLFGQGFRRLFQLAHELVIKSGHSSQSIRLRGNWVDIDPSQWRAGRDLRVVAPYAAGNKDNLLQRLMVLKQIHAEALAGGLPIVTPEDSYELALEISKAADVSGEKFFTSPEQIPPQEPPPDHTMIALEIENKKADNEALDEERQAEIEQLKVTTDAQVKELTARIQSETQIALAQIKAGQQVDLERFKAQLKNAPVEMGNEAIKAQSEAVSALNRQVSESIKAVTEAISELRATQEAPIEIVRKNGKITGKRVNGKFIPLKESSE